MEAQKLPTKRLVGGGGAFERSKAVNEEEVRYHRVKGRPKRDVCDPGAEQAQKGRAQAFGLDSCVCVCEESEHTHLAEQPPHQCSLLLNRPTSPPEAERKCIPAAWEGPPRPGQVRQPRVRLRREAPERSGVQELSSSDSGLTNADVFATFLGPLPPRSRKRTKRKEQRKRRWFGASRAEPHQTSTTLF